MDDGRHGQHHLFVVPLVVEEFNHKPELVPILLPQMEGYNGLTFSDKK